MRWIEALVVVTLMLVPFVAFKSSDLTTYAYWNVVTAVYLAYISLRRWEGE